MGHSRLVILVLGLAAGLAACGESRRAGGPIRLVGDPAIRREGPFLSWGTVVTIADVPRPVLSASKAVIPPSQLGEPQQRGNRKISAQIPTDFSAIPWLVFETTVTRNGTTSMMRSWPVTTRAAGTTYEVWTLKERVGPDGTPGIRLWPVPDLASRDVETGDVAVPAHATMTVGLGIEPASWDSTVVPIDMTVKAIAGGRETDLSTTRIDVRRPEFKQWTDVSIPLDALGGQTVRFRFSARPIMGPSAVATLPVWGDPTIVAAR